MSEQQQQQPGIAEALADVQVVREQLMAQLADGDLKSVVLDNLLPLIESLATGAQNDIDELDGIVEEIGGAVDELVDETGEIISPATAAQIAGVLQSGKLIASMLEKAMPKLDDLSKKKAKELITMYRQGVALVVKGLQEITAQPDEDPDEQVEPTGETDPEAPDDEDADAKEQG